MPPHPHPPGAVQGGNGKASAGQRTLRALGAKGNLNVKGLFLTEMTIKRGPKCKSWVCMVKGHRGLQYQDGTSHAGAKARLTTDTATQATGALPQQTQAIRTPRPNEKGGRHRGYGPMGIHRHRLQPGHHQQEGAKGDQDEHGRHTNQQGAPR